MNHRFKLSPRRRLFAAAIGLALAVPAAAAGRLTPDVRGWGTHEQLGFAPCRLRQWTGRPCPTCGMTTAWTLAARGEFREAAAANAGGLALWATAVAAAAWLAGSAGAGRWIGGRPTVRTAVGAATVLLAVTIVDWVRRLAIG